MQKKEWLAPRIGWLDAIVLLWYVPLRFEPGPILILWSPRFFFENIMLSWATFRSNFGGLKLNFEDDFARQLVAKSKQQ